MSKSDEDTMRVCGWFHGGLGGRWGAVRDTLPPPPTLLWLSDQATVRGPRGTDPIVTEDQDLGL